MISTTARAPGINMGADDLYPRITYHYAYLSYLNRNYSSKTRVHPTANFYWSLLICQFKLQWWKWILEIISWC
jgi:hypothetical protein